MLQRAHLPAFHTHFLTAHNTSTVFLNIFFESHFLVFLTAHNTSTVFLKKILRITFFSVFLTMEPSQEPSFLTQMMMGSSSSLPLSIVPHTAPPAPPKSKRDWKDGSTSLLMDLFEEKFLANSMNSLTQQQWQEILLRIEEGFPLTPQRTWAQVQSKVHKMRKKFNQLEQEHGESGAKWPWFERCLMIWGQDCQICF